MLSFMAGLLILQSSMIRELLLLLVVSGCVRGQSINNNGTPIDVGGIESIWTATDTAGTKFYAGLNCHTSDTGADDITVDFRAYINGFSLNTGNPFYYNWTQCESLKVSELETNDMALESTDHCVATVSGDQAQYFTHTQVLSVAADSAAVPCGGTYTGTVWKFCMRCQRWPSFDAHLDQIFCYECDQANPANTLVRTLTGPMITVGNIPVENIVRRYEVTMDVIESMTVPTPTTPGITGPISVGAPVWFRFGLSIAAPLDNRTMFDMGGRGPVGLIPYSCYAQQLNPGTDHMQDDFDTDLIGAPVEIIDANGCGTYTPIAQQFQDKRVKWIKDAADGADAMLYSPNHFLIGSFEAVAFLGKNVQIPSAAASRFMLITCSIKYCLTTTAASGEPICFGGGTGTMTDTGYNACPGNPPEAARKRRSTEPDPDLDLPDKVSTIIEIKLGGEKEEKSSGLPKCIANTTFYALTGVLVVLLLVVLAIGGYLTLKLRRVLNDLDSENSMTGIPNKAYY